MSTATIRHALGMYRQHRHRHTQHAPSSNVTSAVNDNVWEINSSATHAAVLEPDSWTFSTVTLKLPALAIITPTLRGFSGLATVSGGYVPPAAPTSQCTRLAVSVVPVTVTSPTPDWVAAIAVITGAVIHSHGNTILLV